MRGYDIFDAPDPAIESSVLPPELIEALPDDAFANITALAASIFGTPSAAVMLVDGHQLRLKSAIGFPAKSFPRCDSFCDSALRMGPDTVLALPDVAEHPTFWDLALKNGEPHIRFYVGAVLATAAGQPFGTLCAFGHTPRDVGPEDRERLRLLAQAVVSEVELRRATRASEVGRRLLDLAEQIAGVGHWRLDVASGHVTWSDEVYRIHGVDRDAHDPNLATGLSFYVDGDGALAQRHVERAIADATGFDFDLRIRRPDGAIRNVRSQAVCELDEGGRPIALVGVFRDHTDEVQRLQALQDSEERYRVIAHHATDIICRFGLDSKPLYISPSLHSVLGYSFADLAGRSLGELLHPEDRPRVGAALTQMRNDWIQRLPFTLEYRARHAEGGWVWLESRPTLVFDPRTGAPVEVIDVMRDVTRRKAQEAELNEARRVAEEASRTKSEFLANMSHELRTPLNSIIGFTAILQKEAGLDAGQRRRLKIVEDAGRNLLCVVNDVLDLSRIEAGRIDLDCRPFVPSQLVEDAATMIRAQAAEKGLTLEVETSSNRSAAIGDPDRLRQVLMNLLSNAVKFTEAGGVRVRLEVADVGSALRMKCAVADTGIGIAPDQLPDLFKRFSQADGSISRRYGGSGLGLAISKRLVEAMHGRFEVESEPGVGSTFTFRLTLPISAAKAASVAPIEASRVEGVLIGRRLLLAEDVEVNQELVRLILEPTGCDLDIVATGAQALEAARSQPYNCILMDLQMPDMDGLEATRRLRAAPGPCRDVPVVALTANVLPEQVARCRAAGMDGHVGKPFHASELIAAVTAARRGGQSAAAAAPRLGALEAQLGYGSVSKLLEAFDRQLARFQAEAPTAGGPALKNLAHAIKGTAGSLGFAELSERAGVLEGGADVSDRRSALSAALDAAAAARSAIAARPSSLPLAS